MKLLATDYDGTLKYGETVMEEDLQAIRDWKAAGNLFAIVTGRSGESIRREIDRYGLPVDYLVCNNGGLIFDEAGNRLYELYMETLAAVDLIYAMKEMDNVVSLVVNDGVARHKIEVNPHLPDHRYGALKPDLSEEEVVELPRYCQVVISMTDSDSAEEVAEQINHFFGDHLQAFPNNFCVDVVAKGISKAEGLAFIGAYANLEDEDLWCIGDGFNDLPMIEYCENGSAISVAPYDVQAQAAHVYDSLHELVQDALLE